MGSVGTTTEGRRSPMNKGGLVAEVAKRTGLSKADVARVIDGAIDAIRETVVRGDRVTLADFGTFERKHRNQRIARNPRKPNVTIVVPARDLPSFTPGKEFRGSVVATAATRSDLGNQRHEGAA
jgi:DNA-binding protein HU-beta